MKQEHKQSLLAVSAGQALVFQKTALDPAFFAGRTISSSYSHWRRAMDLTFGLLGLGVLLLLLPLLAALVYLDSPGPVFYRQERVGRNGDRFRIWKFRSMRLHTEQHVLTMKQYDPRITRVGSFMRKTHLDELPQVLNILRGEMSLVGPRPELPELAAQLEHVNPLYPLRFSVKPGLTGWAQVKHHYGDTLEDEQIKLAYDLHYIRNRSFRLDMKIIVKTVVEVLLAHGR